MIATLQQGGLGLGSYGGSDALLAKVKLGINFTGANGQTSAIDYSQFVRPLTFNGNAQIKTNDATFGGNSSLYVDGVGDYVSANDSADWAVAGSTNFCWELVCKPEGTFAANSDILSQATGAGNYPYRFYRGSGANGGWGLLTFDSGGTLRVNIAPAGTHTDSTWGHVAFVREGTTFRIYKDGVQVASATNAAYSNALFDAPDTLKMGVYNGAGFKGWIQCARFTVGDARYPGGTTFTPPSALFPTS